jgi:putative MATE family efflux protein
VRGNDPSRLSPGTNAVSKSPSLWKTFLVFLAPLMLSNALQSLFGTVTNALLGQMIGVDALAAVSVFFPVMFFLFAFDRQLRGVGDTLTPLLVLAVSTAIGLILTPLLIRGGFGLPATGVTAPAWASAVSTALTLFALGLYLRHKKSPLAPDAEFLRRLRLDGALLGKILGIGIPSAVGMVVMAIAELVLLGLVNGFGSEATAAYGAVNQIMGYAQLTAISISISVSILGAQAIGGGHAGRLDAIVRTGLLFNLVLTGGLVALIYLFPRVVLGIFITDTPVLDLAKGLLTIALWSSVPFGMATVFSGAMRAGGVALTPMLLSIFAITAIEIPSAVILSRTIGLEGVWAAYPIVFCAMFILQLGYYTLIWRRRPLQRLV